jgi:hypothetical protein
MRLLQSKLADKTWSAADRGIDLALRYPSRTSLYATLGLFLVTLLLLTPRYETNDDVGMHVTAAGVMFTDGPDEHLIFSNVIVGLGLKALYNAWPAFPWYGWYHIAGLFLATVAATYGFLTASSSKKRLGLSLLWLLVITMPWLLYIQFTKTAFYLCLSGWLLFASGIVAKQPRTVQTIAGALLIAAGSLVRFESFQMACVIVVPLLGYALLVAGDKGSWLRAARFAAFTIGICYALHLFDGWYYRRDPEWEGVARYNLLRSSFTDYGRATWSPATEPVFRAAGWKPIDLAMIQNWFFADPDTYSEKKLKAIVSGMRPQDRQRESRVPTALFVDMWSNLEFATILLTSVCCTLVMDRRRRARLAPIATACLAVVLSVVLFQYYYLPNHVYTCLFTAVLAAACLFCGGGKEPSPKQLNRRHLGRIALIVFAFWLAGCRLIERVGMSIGKGAVDAEVAQMIRELSPRNDQLFVLWANAFPYEWAIRPFDDLHQYRSFKCVSLGSGSHLPTFARRLEQFDIDNLCWAFYERRDVFLVSIRELSKLMEAYIFEHYGEHVAFEVVDRYRGRFIDVPILQAHRIEPRDERSGGIGELNPPGS